MALLATRDITTLGELEAAPLDTFTATEAALLQKLIINPFREKGKRDFVRYCQQARCSQFILKKPTRSVPQILRAEVDLLPIEV